MAITDTAKPATQALRTTYPVILAVSLCHFINDVMQSVLAAIYPILKDDFQLDYW